MRREKDEDTKARPNVFTTKPEDDEDTRGWPRADAARQRDDERMRRNLERRRERLSRPFGREMAKLCFVLVLLFSLGLGMLEIFRERFPGQSASVADTLGSLLVITLVPGIPVVAICAVQLARIRKGTLSEDAKLYKVYALTTLAILALLLAGWLIFLLMGR